MGPILMEPTFASVSCHVLPYVDVPHCKYVWQGCTSFKRRVSEVGAVHAAMNAWMSLL
jgi:hypothetical protein